LTRRLNSEGSETANENCARSIWRPLAPRPHVQSWTLIAGWMNDPLT